jgi:NAD(P)H-dependent FMN reductase
MKKIIAFGASNSRNSINKTLAKYAGNQLRDTEVKLLDLNDFEMPIFSIDRENEDGIHELAYQFKQEIIDGDGIIISLAEHNGAYSAAFKNIYDWVSRIDGDVWNSKPLFLMATSPGARGGKSVLEMAYNRFHRGYKNIIVTFSLPTFAQNFSIEKGILDELLKTEFDAKLGEFEKAL